MRLWYLRRGIPWTPLLGCCLLALVSAAAGQQWPSSLAVLRPAALACCAAGAGFVFDEAAITVVAVTPRGAAWRRFARLAVIALPLGVWLAIIAVVPASVSPDRPAWALAGTACLVVAAGAAGLCARRSIPAPGGIVASAVAGLVLMPLVVGPLAGWKPVFPQGVFPDWLVASWAAVAGVGVLLTAWALRPGLR